MEKGNGQKDAKDIALNSIVSEINLELSLNIFDALYSIYKRKTDYIHKPIHPSMSKEQNKYNDKRKSRLSGVLQLENDSISSVLIEYCPTLFDYIRNTGESKKTNEFMSTSIDPNNNLSSFMSSESEGKSGSFFLFTHDKALVIKTIKEKEAKNLINIAYDYAEYSSKSPYSLLCKIYGLFYLKLPKITPVYLIVMENILLNCSPSILYDLKGSTLGRIVNKPKRTLSIDNKAKKFSGPLKDLDFIKSKTRIALNEAEYNTANFAISDDANFLRRHNLMDYSLLVSIEFNEGKAKYTYGIIDFLTRYGYTKRLERAFTILLNPKSSAEASVINPKKYAKRFINFILRRVLEKKL